MLFTFYFVEGSIDVLSYWLVDDGFLSAGVMTRQPAGVLNVALEQVQDVDVVVVLAERIGRHVTKLPPGEVQEILYGKEHSAENSDFMELNENCFLP